MPESTASGALRDPLPLILIRGYGGVGVEDEKNNAYQGFNDGTVYPHKRGDNYIYEGLILRLMKSADHPYRDATNVVSYHSQPVGDAPSEIPVEVRHVGAEFFSGDKVVLEPTMSCDLVKSDPLRTIWVFRYYDLNDRRVTTYGKALVRLIDAVQALTSDPATGKKPKVNIIAHSMGGLIVREAVQVAYPESGRKAAEHVNKIVTLGTPHKGISFQVLEKWIGVPGAEELERFNEDNQGAEKPTTASPAPWKHFRNHFPLERLLTVVGTNYRSYNIAISSSLNRLFSLPGEFGLNYNRSDGLVKQTNAQIDGAPRTFVHKCHGGFDSLVTSREAYEIATRFFFGNVKARLRLVRADIKTGKDFFGKSEFFFGASIKPRSVDFHLFNQKAEAENCYGPFHQTDLSDEKVSFPWAGEDRLIWEGWLDTDRERKDDLVIRVDIYVGERDLSGLGFSDNVIYNGQVFIQAKLDEAEPVSLYKHDDQRFISDPERSFASDARLDPAGSRAWTFDIESEGFDATFQVELEPLA
ncbi:MAG: hypothetical protein HY876_05150 [Coriobacteriales bacterium]|nr:hypothetical protein [Coriobacteriales bacterium]